MPIAPRLCLFELVPAPRRAIPFAFLFLAAAAILAFAAGCAGKPAAPSAAPPPPAEPVPYASLAAGKVLFLDQSRRRLPLLLELANPGSAPLRVESAGFSLEVEGSAAPLSLSAGSGSTVPAGGSLSIPIEFLVDLGGLDEATAGPGGPPSAAFRCSARIAAVGASGAPLALAAAAEGRLPIVREPVFRITSLKIERDILVTTNLRLGLEVENPNDFPLALERVDYDFYGERKLWADGESVEASPIPPRSRVERGLRFTMNFTNVDRRLFDLVADLRTVNYRLAGKALVSTSLEGLPSFALRFDREGSCAVER